MTDEEKLTKLRTIVSEHQANEIGGVLVDATTANLLVKVYDALNETNKAKFLSLSISGMAGIAWKLAN